MNRFIAGVTGALNALIAGCLLLLTLVLASAVGKEAGFGAGLVVVIAGIVVTTILCGVIAIFDDIRRTLHEIRDSGVR